MSQTIRPILYIGGATFEQWKQVSHLLPDEQFANNAIGETVTSQWLEWIDDEIQETHPCAVCYYCGSNDLNFDVHPIDIITNIVKTFTKIKFFNPHIPIIYHSIIISPQQEHKIEEVIEINETLKYHMEDLESGHFLDLNNLISPHGAIRSELFKTNGHHLTRNAYKEIAAYVRPLMQQIIEKEVTY